MNDVLPLENFFSQTLVQAFHERLPAIIRAHDLCIGRAKPGFSCRYIETVSLQPALKPRLFTARSRESLPARHTLQMSTALVSFFYATKGPQWRNSENWLSDAPLGTWYGITTNSSDNVTGVALKDNHLSGSIPSQLGNLSNLTWLDLSSNWLNGHIPPQLANLKLLDNMLCGPIPLQLTSLIKEGYRPQEEDFPF